MKTSDGKIYERHGVQNLPCDTPERMLRLQLDKGLASYEDEITQGVFDEIKDSPVLLNFLYAVVPQTLPYDWLRKQRVMDSNAKINVAGELLYDECPQTILPKQSGIRILRYRIDESEGERGTLEDGFPISIEGDIYSLINKTVSAVKKIVEKVGVIRARDDIKTIQGNLGHSGAAFTPDRYGHLTERMKRDSATRMESFIKGVLNL